ncbi:hypothetical protein B0H14DRAFT_2614866 [Mycena olivaceomarginata]|nr:hypothetical protein B0H14DRAFT_2614866 [Mycena olivaceomarginata]
MPRVGTAARRRERAGQPDVRPGKAHKDDFLAAAEIQEQGAFYSRIAHLYLAKYGYNMGWDEDLENGQDVADDVDTTLDVNSLLPEEAETRAAYFKALHVKIGVWYNGKYGGGVQKKKQQNLTFKQLFDKKELEPQVTKEAWLAETQAFRDEVIESLNKEHEVAMTSYKIALANDVPTTAEEYSVALNNAAFYLGPFADAAHAQFGMNVSILLCGPIPDRGGRIEVRSIHVGFSNGLVPRIWSDFDRAGFDAAQRSFVAFTHNCFTEEQCQERSLAAAAPVANDTDAADTDADDDTDAVINTAPQPQPIPTTDTVEIASTEIPANTTSHRVPVPLQQDIPLTSMAPAQSDIPVIAPVPPNRLVDSMHIPLLPPGDLAQWVSPEGWGQGLADDAFGMPEIPLANLLNGDLLFGVEMERSSEVDLSFLGEHPGAQNAFTENRRAQAEGAREAGAAEQEAQTAALREKGKAAVQELRTVRPTPKPMWRGAVTASLDVPLDRPETNPDAEGSLLQSSVQKLLDVPLERPETSPDAEGPLQSLVTDRADARPETEGVGDEGMSEDVKKEVSQKEEVSQFWEAEEDWPEELRKVFRGFKRGKGWGGEAWMCCVRELIALEQAGGFQVKGMTVPQGDGTVRPVEVPNFMQHARKWDKTLALTSAPGPISVAGSFSRCWWDWWVRVQPESWVLENGKLKSTALVPVEEWKKVSTMTGKNGMLLYVGALLWWGEAAAGAEEGSTDLLRDWAVAAIDVACVLAMAVGAIGASGDTVNSGEEVGDAECAKRKRMATSSDTGKENEKPKKHRKAGQNTSVDMWEVLVGRSREKLRTKSIKSRHGRGPCPGAGKGGRAEETGRTVGGLRGTRVERVFGGYLLVSGRQKGPRTAEKNANLPRYPNGV